MAFVPDTRQILTTGPLTGGGTLAGDLTLAIPQATGGQAGYLAAADFAIFAAKLDASAGVPNTRTVSTTAPLTGGGALSGNLTLVMAKATGAVDGYLAASDFTIFNAKQTALGYTAEDQANKVTAFSSPTNAQYPSALLVSNSLALKADASAFSNVTNDAQTKAAIVPNTVPAAGQVLVGNAGGTAYAPVTLSGGAVINSAGVVTLTIPDASSTVKGATKLSVDPVSSVNPIAWGQNDTNVEQTGNKVTAFSSPTNVQYPSALLVSTSLGLKIDKQTAITPATQTKITYNADGVITAGAAATTADIAASTDKNYVTDARLAAVNLLSGTNSGDQNLAPYALATDLATTNSNISSLNNILANYALATDLGTVNTNLAAVSSGITANNEVKLTISTGLTRVGNTITNDALNVAVAAHRWLGNNTGGSAVPTFSQPAVADLSDGSTGTGNVVLKTGATLLQPLITGPLLVTTLDLLNTVVTSVIQASHDITGGGGTPAVGMGTAIDLLIQSTSTPDRLAGRVSAVWTNATDVSRTSKLVLQPIVSGSLLDTTSFTIFGQSGGASLGDINYNPGFGFLNVAAGIVVGSAIATAGNVLRSNGTTGFVSSPILSTDLHKKTMTEHVASKFSLTDQTVAAETVHFTYTVPINDAFAGGVYRLRAWGTIDNSTTIQTFTPRIRWGGVAGVVLMATPTIVNTATALAGKTWNLEAIVMVTATGAAGTAQTEVVLHDHTTLSTGVLTVQEDNSGTTGTVIDTTAAKDLVLTWAISGIVGAPHVRTCCGYVELLA